MADEILDRLVKAIEKLSSNGDQLPKPQKLTMYDDYDLWEDRMKLYLESVSEGNRSLAILGQLDSDVYAVARAANITSSLTTATIFERLRREFEDRILDNFVDGIANLDIRRKFMLDPPKTLKAALDSARDEELIYAALSPSPGPSSSVPSGPRFQTAPLQSQMVNVFAMGPRPTCDIGTQTARWQWDPQPQSTPRYDHQRSTPRRGDWRDQRGRWTRPQYRPGVHTITAGEEEESEILIKNFSQESILQAFVKNKVKHISFLCVVRLEGRFIVSNLRFSGAALVNLLFIDHRSSSFVPNHGVSHQYLSLTMRRGVGVGAIKNRSIAQSRFKEKKNEMEEFEAAVLSRQLEELKSSLEEFASKYQSKIRQDKQFRAQFQSMCANIGVDPLASSNGYWSKILGIGDFYYHLGVRIIEVCMANQRQTGGLMPLSELIEVVNKTRSSRQAEASQDDVVRAIKKLRCLGSGFTLIDLPGSGQLVQSVPGEMSMDQTKVLGLAESNNGSVSVHRCVQQFRWTEERTLAALNYLLQEGMAWIDDDNGSGSNTYWFPSLFKVTSK
ncbi:ESCRT-II subunit protein snf8 [Sparganum proliferum]